MITKAVIPAAGYGTRFLPITKAIPKEMLPIIDKPVIQYVVEEAVNSGIKEILFVITPQKKAIKEYFSPSPDLENYLKKAEKSERLKEIQAIAKMAKFHFIDQKGPYGNGTPVLCAKEVVGNEPFAVIWGDEFWDGENETRLCQLIETFKKYNHPVITVKDITREETKKYGVIDGQDLGNGTYKVKSLVEKPGPQKALSLIGSLGGYILTPDIFEILENTPLGKDNELWLVDAIIKLGQRRPLYAKKIAGKYYDIGSPQNWLKTNLDFAKKRRI